MHGLRVFPVCFSTRPTPSLLDHNKRNQAWNLHPHTRNTYCCPSTTCPLDYSPYILPVFLRHTKIHTHYEHHPHLPIKYSPPSQCPHDIWSHEGAQRTHHHPLARTPSIHRYLCGNSFDPKATGKSITHLYPPCL